MTTRPRLRDALVVRPLIAVIVVATVGLAPGASAPRPITPATVAAVDAWVSAVNLHAPGRGDETLVKVARLGYDDRVELNSGLPLFFATLVGRNVGSGGSPHGAAIVAIARRAAIPDPDAFLKRAAVLHSDAAALLDLSPATPDDAGRARGPAPREMRTSRDSRIPRAWRQTTRYRRC